MMVEQSMFAYTRQSQIRILFALIASVLSLAVVLSGMYFFSRSGGEPHRESRLTPDTASGGQAPPEPMTTPDVAPTEPIAVISPVPRPDRFAEQLATLQDLRGVRAMLGANGIDTTSLDADIKAIEDHLASLTNP